MAEAARKKRPWTERFTMGLAGDLPDRAVPGPLKQAQLALAAPADSVRRKVGDLLQADSAPGDYLVPGGPMVGAMDRKQIGGLVNDPVRQGMEMIDDAGARADAAYAKIKPVDYPKAQPTRAARRQTRKPQDAYTPYEISPEDQALLAQRAQYLKQNAAEDEAPGVAATAAKERQGVTLSANGAPGRPVKNAKSYKQMVADGEYPSIGAAYRAVNGGKGRQPEAMVRQGALVDRDAVAKALNDIYERNDYALPRDYATQIAKKLGRNPQSIRRALFNMREAGDPRVADIGGYEGAFGVLNTGRKLALPLTMTGGQAYVADKYRREQGYQLGLQ